MGSTAELYGGAQGWEWSGLKTPEEACPMNYKDDFASSKTLQLMNMPYSSLLSTPLFCHKEKHSTIYGGGILR